MAAGTVMKPLTPGELPGRLLRYDNTATKTVAANGSTGPSTIDVSRAGQKALCVAGFYVSGVAAQNNSVVNQCYLSNSTTVTYNIANISGTAREWVLHVYVLYVSNS